MLTGLLPDLELLRQDFPVLQRRLSSSRPLVYLDSANTSQKPQVVIDTMVEFLERRNANIARAMHQLGAEATEAFEAAREAVAQFVGAPESDEIIFTKNASEALNLVAQTVPLTPADRVVVTEMEHHSNLVPWQLATQRSGAELTWFGLTDEGHLDLSVIDELITPNTKVVALTWVSNMLGTINPIGLIARRAHEVGALVVVDAAQAAAHLSINVSQMEPQERPDFLAFTGHKVVGPTGIGVLWGARTALEQLPPFLGGGEMIATVTMERSTWAPIPAKFEAGTPPIVEAVGLGAAVQYLQDIGLDRIRAHETALTEYLLQGLSSVKGVHVLGPPHAEDRAALASFIMHGVHPHDVAQVLDSRGIAVRAGHHCAKPAHQRFQVQASTRASAYLYTTPDEIDALIEGLEYTRHYFKVA